jgi:ammonia channel protein AmtB
MLRDAASSALVFIKTPDCVFLRGLVKRKNVVNTIRCLLSYEVASILWVLIGFSLPSAATSARYRKSENGLD